MRNSTIVLFYLFFLNLPIFSYAQNVGIGITNPLEKLDIDGDLLVRGQDIYLTHDGTTNTNNDYLSYHDGTPTTLGGVGIFHFHADAARGATWQQPSASISADGAYFSGRVGIGTSSPSTLTHISSGTANDAILRLEADTDDNNEDDNPRLEMYQDAGTTGVMLGFHDGSTNFGNTFRIGTHDSGTDDWATFSIDISTKDVGIGTATPDERLELNGGGIQINGEFGIGFFGDIPYDGNATNDRAKIYYDLDFVSGNDFLVFEKTDFNHSNPDGGMVFTMKGSDNVRTPALTIRGNARVGLQTVTNPGYALDLPNNTSAGIGRARANAWVTYSDGRLKEHRQTIPYGLKTVLQLNPLAYQHHHSTTDEAGHLNISTESSSDIGFIAQELHTLVPEAVYVPSNENQDLWAVDYTRLVPVLTKAIQEQQEMYQEQQKMLQELNQKYNMLIKEYQALQNATSNSSSLILD